MKKIKILFPISVLCLSFGVSFASASDVGLIATIQGSPMVFLSVNSSDTSGTYYDGENINTKKVTSHGTTIEEKENATTTKKNEKNENDSISLVSTSTINFEIDGNDERSKENRGAIISDVAQVHTGDDLHLFVQSIVHENKDIESMSSQDDRVSVTRNVNTKLFGFIPSSIKETVSVISWGDGTNQVTISRPWWNFLSKDEVTASTTQNAVEARINTIPSAEWKAILDAGTKARIILEIQNAFLTNATTTTP